MSDKHPNNPIVPLFLLKTFSILNSAPEDIISWSEQGDSFIVKDADRFSDEVIAANFKHNKFSSFVRQLNFYGFRKVKGKLNSSNNKSEQNAWEFRHPYFLRGRPDLLIDIKRSAGLAEDSVTECSANVSSSSTSFDVTQIENNNLRKQVEELTARVKELEKNVAQLQSCIIVQGMSSAGDITDSVSELSSCNEDSLSTTPLNNVFESDQFPAEWDSSMFDCELTELLNETTVAAPAEPSPLKRQRSVDAFAESFSTSTSDDAFVPVAKKPSVSPLPDSSALVAFAQTAAFAAALSTGTVSAPLLTYEECAATVTALWAYSTQNAYQNGLQLPNNQTPQLASL